MNFHVEILAQSAFLYRPESLTDLHALVNIIDEKHAVSRVSESGEAFMRDMAADLRDYQPVRSLSRLRSRSLQKCWNCKKSGHFSRNCPRRPSPPGNGTAPRGVTAPEHPS